MHAKLDAGAAYGGGRLLETGRVSAAVNTRAFKGAVPAVAVGGAGGSVQSTICRSSITQWNHQGDCDTGMLLQLPARFLSLQSRH